MTDESDKTIVQKLKELVEAEGEDLSSLLNNEDVHVNLLESTTQKIPDFTDLGYACETEDEFDERMLLRITGSDKFPFIVQNPTQYTRTKLEIQKAESIKEGHPFIIPSVVTPANSRDKKYYFTPYILFFIHDAKLFIYPAKGNFFSDMEPE